MKSICEVGDTVYVKGTVFKIEEIAKDKRLYYMREAPEVPFTEQSFYCPVGDLHRINDELEMMADDYDYLIHKLREFQFRSQIAVFIILSIGFLLILMLLMRPV